VASQPSNEAVNRAGRLIAALLLEFQQSNFEEMARLETVYGDDGVEGAFELIDWWRSRALLPDQSAVYEVAKHLRRNWDVTRTRDYAAEPKESGYRAVHLIVKRKGRLIEVQLRTPLQDAWANQVEEDSRRVGRNFKGGQGQQEVHSYYAVVSELLALREDGQEPDEGLRQRLLDSYEAAQPFLTNDSGGRR